MDRRAFLATSMSALAAALIPTALADIVHKNTIRILAAGDTTLGSFFNEQFAEIERYEGRDAAFRFPFQEVKRYFQQADISLVNLEGALTLHETRRPKQFNFRGDPDYVHCLSAGSINAVNLANNHLMDFYAEGALDTIDALQSEGIACCGAGRNIDDAIAPSIIETRGKRIALLGFAQVGGDYPATASRAGPCSASCAVDAIRNARPLADFVVVSAHWGNEYQREPSPRQRELGHSMIEAGADVIFGHHPHVIQGIERYRRGVIFYSLGNFCFGGNTYSRDRDALIAEVQLTDKGVQYTTIPVITHPSPRVFQPFVPEGEDAARILRKIRERSEGL